MDQKKINLKLNKLFDSSESKRDVFSFYQNILKYPKETEIRLIDKKNGKPPFSTFVHSLKEFYEVCSQYNGHYNVYAGINERRTGGTKKSDVLNISCLWFDADAHNGEDIKEAEKDVNDLVSLFEKKFVSLKYMIEFTGHGYSLFIPIQPLDVKYEDDWREFQRDMVEELKGGEKTGSFDPSVWEIARIMRVPGTINIKSDPVKSFVYAFNNPDNPNNEQIAKEIIRRGSREGGKITGGEGGNDEREKKLWHWNEGEQRVLCEWQIENLGAEETTHDVRREIVTRLNLWLITNGYEGEERVNERKKIIFDWINGRAKWNDYDEKTTSYQINNIVLNGYRPAKCQKTSCPFKKSCNHKNYWMRQKGIKRTSRYKKGSDSFNERYPNGITDLLPNGDDCRHIIDCRHTGAGKSTDALNAWNEGTYVYSSIKQRDDWCNKVKDLYPVKSRFEWGREGIDPTTEDGAMEIKRRVNAGEACGHLDIITKSVEHGDKPVSCSWCKDCYWVDKYGTEHGFCKYMDYNAEATLKTEHKKIAVVKDIFKSYNVQKREDPFVLDDCSIFDLTHETDIKIKDDDLIQSFDDIYGKARGNKDGMVEEMKKTFETALHGEGKRRERARERAREESVSIERLRNIAAFNGVEIPINVMRLALSYHHEIRDVEDEATGKVEKKHVFKLYDPSILFTSEQERKDGTIKEGKLKDCRYLTATPSVEDAILLKQLYPNAKVIKEEKKIAKGVKVRQITDGAYPLQTLKYDRTKRRLEKALKPLLDGYKALGLLDRVIIWAPQKVMESFRFFIKDYDGVLLDHYYSRDNKNVNSLQYRNIAVILGTPPVRVSNYENIKESLSKNLTANIEEVLSEEEYMYLTSRDTIIQCIGRMRPYDKNATGEITLFTNINFDFLGDIEKTDLDTFINARKKDVWHNIPAMIKRTIKSAKGKVVLHELAKDISASLGLNEQTVRDRIDKEANDQVRLRLGFIKKDRSKHGRGRPPLVLVLFAAIRQLNNFFDNINSPFKNSYDCVNVTIDGDPP